MHSIAYHLAKKQDNFQLLRIIAALMVIYGHSFALAQDIGTKDIFLRFAWPMYSGDIAVAMFFVISGFMVSGSYIGRANLTEFMLARLLRIVPAMLVVLLVCTCVGVVFTTLDARAYFASSDTWRYLVQNLRFSSDMVWTLPGVFQGHRLQPVNGSLWTLPAEMRMYLLVAAMGVLGLLRGWRLGTLAVLLLIIAGILHPRLLPLHTDWLRLAAYFCVGILAQLHKERIEIRHDVMFVLVFLTYISYNTDSFRWLFGATVSYFCFWFAYRTPYIDLGKFGDPSYGIYLWGWPLQQAMISWFPSMTPTPNFLLGAAAAVMMGSLSWHAIERPALSLKGRIGRWLARLQARRGVTAAGVDKA